MSCAILSYRVMQLNPGRHKVEALLEEQTTVNKLKQQGNHPLIYLHEQTRKRLPDPAYVLMTNNVHLLLTPPKVVRIW